MVARHLATGAWGEDMAAAWYADHGYVVLTRNWRCPAGELDIVVRRGRTVVIVEVKARRSDRYGPASSAVHPDKQRRLRRLAAEWLRTTRTHGVEVRFDVVSITAGRVEVIHSAF